MPVLAEGFDASEDCGGGFAGDGLVGNRSEEDFVRLLRVGDIYFEWDVLGDELFELLVRREVADGGIEVKGESHGGQKDSMERERRVAVASERHGMLRPVW